MCEHMWWIFPKLFCCFSSSMLYSFALYSDSRTKMPPRPQFSQPQWSFLAMELHRRRGTKNSLPGLPADFAAQFPDARVPSERVIRDLHKKFLALGRINNKNSKSSPGVTHSGRPKTSTCNQCQIYVTQPDDKYMNYKMNHLHLSWKMIVDFSLSTVMFAMGNFD